MPKISIIMPCLNMAAYIRQCMDSVIHQTLKDIEILAVDAGSTDGTVEILKEYTRKDQRIHLIHSDKRSYGYQVNIGISFAEGEYVGIVDTDDLVAEDAYEVLYREAMKFDTDYCKGIYESFIDIPWFGRITSPDFVFAEGENITGRRVDPSVMPELLMKDRYLWNGIYRRDFIRKIKLNETPGAAYQDLGFIFQAYCMAKKAIYLDKVVYYYRKDNPGASGYDRKAFSHLVKEYDYVESFLADKKKEWKAAVYEKMLLHCLSHISIMAYEGEFWEESLTDIEIMQGKLREAVNNGILHTDESAELKEKFRLFTSEPHVCFEFYKKQAEAKKQAVGQLLQKIRGHKVSIFGAGRIGQFLHVMIICDGQDLEAYCDNNVRMQGSEILKVQVMSLEDAAIRYPDAVYIVANKYHAREMEGQLRRLGIPEDRIYSYLAGADSISFYRYLKERR